MFNSERQLGSIEDLPLPLDITTRYDVYFTDKRIAIVCMGNSRRFDSGASERRSYLFGVAPEALTNAEEQRKNRQIMEAQIKELTLDEKIKLSRKSCFYTYGEIEEVKLISGKKPKFAILSKECITKFSPNVEQFKQLTNLLPTIDNDSAILRESIVKSVGRQIGFLLPKSFGSTEKNYEFDFQVDTVKRISWKDYTPVQRVPAPQNPKHGIFGLDNVTTAVIVVGVLGFSAYALSVKKNPASE